MSKLAEMQMVEITDFKDSKRTVGALPRNADPLQL